jgi:hypothetical protein
MERRAITRDPHGILAARRDVPQGPVDGGTTDLAHHPGVVGHPLRALVAGMAVTVLQYEVIDLAFQPEVVGGPMGKREQRPEESQQCVQRVLAGRCAVRGHWGSGEIRGAQYDKSSIRKK